MIKRLLLVLTAVGFVVVGGGVASAHILPTTTVALDVHSGEIDAALSIPVSDLDAASGIDLSAGVDGHADDVLAYLADHIRPTTVDGVPWTVTFDEPTISSTENLGTGVYDTLTTTAHLVPPVGADERTFDLGYDAVIDRVVTHTVLVTVHSDFSTGDIDSVREIGTVSLDTVTGNITPLTVRLDDGSVWQGFLSMVKLGISHIEEGTDHQLFLLTLLLPAPLLVASRRWSGATTPMSALRRIGAITISFTIGHSVTLALGAVGLPVTQQPIEVLIAVSILVAAAHAIRPIFPGREALIAGLFGLVHGMAFSTTLTELDLTGTQLAVSVLGFNIGIELMQLAVVALVLPPLIVLARTRVYGPLRNIVAVLTGIAAIGWVLDRVGIANPVASVADQLGAVSLIIAALLWVAAAISLVMRRTQSTDNPQHALV